MDRFFYWVGELSNTEIIGYATVLCVIMLFIPVSEVFFKLMKKVIFMKRMKINYFSYQFYPVEVSIEKNGENIRISAEQPDFLIENTKVKLFWKVEGALSVSLYPKHGKVKGNMAEVIVNRNHREFSLIVKGLFSRQRIDLVIPIEKIKTIETKEISETDILTQVSDVKSYSFSNEEMNNMAYTEQLPNNLRYSENKTSNISFGKLPYHISKPLIFQNAENLMRAKKELTTRTFSGKIMKQYSFSTRKYNKVNQFNNPNS
jgi:hypothetical protein